MGIRGSQTTELVFTDCEVPAENLIGREGEGFKIAMATPDRTRPGVAAQAQGIAQGAFDFAVDYVKTRT
jgi:alkylation response protein AidB-like acyl-CoA dehydrogenase